MTGFAVHPKNHTFEGVILFEVLKSPCTALDDSPPRVMEHVELHAGPHQSPSGFLKQIRRESRFGLVRHPHVAERARICRVVVVSGEGAEAVGEAGAIVLFTGFTQEGASD
jgi:hypothetical protein